MKTLIGKIQVVVLLTGLIFSSCSKDDPSATDNLVGTWTAGASTAAITVGTKTLTQYYIDVVHLTASEAQLYSTVFTEVIKQGFTGTVTMKSDNTFTSTLGGSADNGTWILSADGKKLTIDSSTDVPAIFDIVELTSKSLKLKITETDTDDLNGDGTPETLNITAEINFTK